MSSKVVVRLEKNGEVPVELTFESARQFRLFYLDREGYPRLLGKLPWGTMKKPLREWLRDWTAEQDIAEFEAALKDRFPMMSLESLLALLHESSGEAKAYFEEECGKRDGAIAFHIIMEMVKAAVYRLRKGNMRALTQWEFLESPIATQNGYGIRDWLFKRR